MSGQSSHRSAEGGKLRDEIADPEELLFDDSQSLSDLRSGLRIHHQKLDLRKRGCERVIDVVADTRELPQEAAEGEEACIQLLSAKFRECPLERLGIPQHKRGNGRTTCPSPEKKGSPVTPLFRKGEKGSGELVRRSNAGEQNPSGRVVCARAEEFLREGEDPGFRKKCAHLRRKGAAEGQRIDGKGSGQMASSGRTRCGVSRRGYLERGTVSTCPA